MKLLKVLCKYCGREVDSGNAFFGEFFKDNAEKGWICDLHIDDINTIAHLTYVRVGKTNHLYMATRGELRRLLQSEEVSDIRILKAEINVQSIHDRWKPRKRSEAYRRRA